MTHKLQSVHRDTEAAISAGPARRLVQCVQTVMGPACLLIRPFKTTSFFELEQWKFSGVPQTSQTNQVRLSCDWRLCVAGLVILDPLTQSEGMNPSSAG